MDDKFRAKKISKYTNGVLIADLGGSHSKLHFYLKKKFPKIDSYDLQEGTDFNKPFKLKKKYSVIIVAEVIEHLENPIRFLRICKRFIKPNGRLIVTTPNAGLQYLLNPAWEVSNNYGYPGHKYIFTMPMLCKILEDEGFKIVHKEYLNTFWYNPIFKAICFFFLRLRNDLFIVADLNYKRKI